MILKDIDLDLPYQENPEKIKEVISQHNLSEEAAIEYDYRENWKDKRILFRDQVRCIAEMYTYLLGKYKTQETKKIIINCQRELIGEKIITVDGFTEVDINFDIDNYFKLSNSQKKQIILKIINESVLKIARKYSWNEDIFDQINQEIIEKNYNNEYVWKKKISPNRALIAEVFCQHDIESIEIFIVIRDKKSNEVIKRELIIKDRPHELIFVNYLGDLKWISNNEVALIHRNKNKKWIVTV